VENAVLDLREVRRRELLLPQSTALRAN